ncbi:hypothetical protein [Thermasporomyces composti]|jgi:hypothetical protein|uniref:Uncharacterized protein n=1 Tax=Thermasporomyces composti TaxID=696763 RepID=A0A3D9V8A8_THECX|nr:hypothetical protein [Thermasporomyces composti]REF36943.1 hypothetical protein DFJ64_2379 [Thermasporomyces composti]
MSGPDAPDPGPDIPEPDFRPPEDGGPDLPDSEIPETPETQTPGTDDLGPDIILEPDIDQAIDQMDVHEGEELYTDELLPESESVEWEPPDEPSPLSREESGSQEDLDDPAFRDSATESLDEGDLGEAYTDEENEDEELGNEVLEPDDRDVDDA